MQGSSQAVTARRRAWLKSPPSSVLDTNAPIMGLLNGHTGREVFVSGKRTMVR